MPQPKHHRGPLLESLESRVLMHDGHTHAFSASINFQPAGAPVPTGYLADTGSVYGTRASGLTYGWNTAAAVDGVRDRNSTLSADQRYDTLNHIRAGYTWQIAVPNGQAWKP